MKTQKMTVWQWIKSLFVKKLVELKAVKEQIAVDPELDWDSEQVLYSEEKVKQDPFCKTYTSNEIPILTTEKKFNNHKNFFVDIDGDIYELTEKQFVFYNIIKNLQSESSLKTVNGRQVMLHFYKTKYPDLSLSEIKSKIPPQKLHFTNYNNTTKYLYKSNILMKIKKNEYRVRV